MSRTFREIEAAEGVVSGEIKKDSSLEEWYARVRDVPLTALRVEDLCKSVRQCLYLEHVIPVALDVLEREPMAGEMYDGELASAFRVISETFWREHRQIATRTQDILKVVLQQIDDDYDDDVLAVLARIEAVTGQR